ncbi:MAG: HK97 gp10 family phage protein [Candidatus Omnitrophica bacterium]|nr:HK97 gp10 family phage protein [Candidatus Omnitrophota bacterium]
MTTEVKIEGFRELAMELKGLEPKLQKRVFGKVVRAGSKVVLKDARRRAPKRSREWEGASYPNPPGTLRKGIIVRRKRGKSFGIIRDVIGFSKAAWYGRLVETGHRIVVGGTLAGGSKRRKTKGTPFTRSGRATTSGQGRVVGHVPPKPFLRPAFDNNIERVLTQMKQTLRSEIDKLPLRKLKSGT